MDAHVNALDIQICLFLRNAITIDEVVKSTSAFKKKQQRRRMSELAASTRKSNPYSLRGVDKESRTRLELYQRLLYLLQTEPGYLARMLSMCGRRELDSSISTRLIESTVLSLFGYATNAREEYLLINLCKVYIHRTWPSFMNDVIDRILSFSAALMKNYPTWRMLKSSCVATIHL